MKPLNLDEQRAVAVELVAQVMLADGMLANREVDALDRHGIAQLLGVSRDALVGAVIERCERTLDGADPARTPRLVDIEEFERTVDRVTDPELRELVCRAMLVLAKSDGVISPPEQTLLRNVLTRWEIPLEQLRD
ncbi:TerB family tellurite resistance protein [Aromatoleum sp.]|uniref:TerB family tellurite resistance protein n=1 Tax=Aromatoleum sp. TaxID=2307007 RepID=UPI002FCC4DE9